MKCQLNLHSIQLPPFNILYSMIFILPLPDTKKLDAHKNFHTFPFINHHFLNEILLKHLNHSIFINITTNLLNPSLFPFDRKIFFNCFLSSFSEFIPFVHICDVIINLSVILLKLNFGYFCMAVKFCIYLLMVQRSPLVFNIFAF